MICWTLKQKKIRFIPEFEDFNPTQVDDFKVYSNTLKFEHKHIPKGTFPSDCFDYLKYFSLPYIPLTSRIFIDQLKVEVPSPWRDILLEGEQVISI